MNTANPVMNGNLVISNYLSEVIEDWNESRSEFPKNVFLQEYWPIPFFGNPRKAVVATVGVNPSSGEFSLERNWTEVETKRDWKLRLKNYFDQKTPPHVWFEPWRIGLEAIDVSYKEGTAAHFDVSYRPTIAMLRNPKADHAEFRRMVERDVAWLFKLLSLCSNLRLLLIFGPIVRADGSKESLADFLKSRSLFHGFKVLQNCGFQHNETGRVFFVHEADTPGEKSITDRVAKNLHAYRNKLRQQIE